MTNQFSMWAQGIVMAVIIGTVLQIILPENKNKKYIKVVIGIYVLFCIIHPVAGNSFDLNNYDINQYIEINGTTTDNENKFDNNVKKLFHDKVKNAIKQHLNSRGYDTNSIEVITDEEYNVTSVKIANIIEWDKKKNGVRKVEVSIKDKPVTGMAIGDKYELKKYIAETYNIEEGQVVVE